MTPSRSEDRKAFWCLLSLLALYASMSYLAYNIIHLRHVTPLGADAPPDRFSEARAVEHVRYLSDEIEGRQEGKPGLREAERYIVRELESIKARAGPGFRVNIETTLVDGSFNMMFIGHSVSLAYRNHTNVIMRVESASYTDFDAYFLVNGHFDAPVGSPGAGDCASCVASMLEVVRLIIDSDWIPPKPVIFLFNGAEELFLLGSHGFVTSHELADKIGAFINIEASGTGGLDLVCQSGPGSWPSFVYAKSAVYPMALSAAQDIFGVIPGDTDYRILSNDYGKIPGLDIIFVIGGYFYHTSYDTLERLLPGSIQARGDNLFSLIKAFTSSPMLRNTRERHVLKTENIEDQAVYFDYLSWFMVFYTRRIALLAHSLPTILFLLLPVLLNFPTLTIRLCFTTFLDLLKGTIFHITAVILSISVPVIFAVARLFFSNSAMAWFAQPYLAFMMFVPCSVIGLLTPITVFGHFPVSQVSPHTKKTKKELSIEACFWGAFAFYGFLTMVYLVCGLNGGFLAYFLSLSMAVAWFLFLLACKHFGNQSAMSLVVYLIPLIPALAYSVYFGGFLVQFVIEKMGMMGALPPPYGYFIPDVLVAAVIGSVTGLCMGPLLPVVGYWLGRMSIMKFLLQAAVIALAVSSQFFPYSTSAPKRVVLQHTFLVKDAHTIVDSSYDFSVVDANSLEFLFKHSPDAANELKINSDISTKTATHSGQCSWLALYPVSFLFSGSLKFPATYGTIFDRYHHMPQLSVTGRMTCPNTLVRKVYLELNLGSLQEVWVTVLNITGPLSNWSFSDSRIPAHESINGGPPSYVCRLSGSSHEKWTFWLEANNLDPLRVDVAVLDQHLRDDAKKLKNLFPRWADVTAYSSFFSTYYL